jgi:signal-transduction protein with cAMP-binding, CBS, and nucleotidyltransferase domain
MTRSDPQTEEYLEYLEPDAPGRRTLDDRFLREPISLLGPATPVCAEVGTSVGDVVRQMQDHHIGCVLVVSQGELAGIFTERDFLRDLAGSGVDLDAVPVERYMTADPEALQPGDSIAFALNKMSLGGFRHIPLVDDGRRPVGIISVKDIVDHIVDFFGAEVMNVPPEPGLDVAKDRDGA